MMQLLWWKDLLLPWLLDPFSFLQGCSRSRRDAVCSVIATFVLLVGASVADDVVPAGSCVFASGLVRRALSALALPPVSCVAGRCPPSFGPPGVLRPKPRWGRAWSPIWFFRDAMLIFQGIRAMRVAGVESDSDISKVSKRLACSECQLRARDLIVAVFDTGSPSTELQVHLRE
jgi:hypothetical protein